MTNFAFVYNQLKELEADKLLRKLCCMTPAQGAAVSRNSSSRRLVNFSSNDYLNLACDGRVVDAGCEAIRRWGFGASASRLICGTMEPHVALEREFAAFFRKEAALLFTSGWTANEAILRALPRKGDLILMDKADHASIIDAAAASEAEFRTFRRDDLSRLNRLLEKTKYNRKFIVTESIFSMDGDSADLAPLVNLKKAHDAILIVDEAHSAGCMGATGAGLAEELGLLADIDILVAPLGKAFGAAGAVVAAERAVVDYLVNTARPFIYTTAPPPANSAAALAALEIVRSEPQRRRQLSENASYLRRRLTGKSLNIGNSMSHIVPVIIGEPHSALTAAERLCEKGFLLVAIRPPTVPPGTARLRISVQASHTREQFDALAEGLADVLQA
ncbi:MAG: 8-amino-7-oxononanoate synthase [Phycisphaerae bacterium]|nr:8-amino-7-oxononanoate synthase [Phycisphaerae bacterium]